MEMELWIYAGCVLAGLGVGYFLGHYFNRTSFRIRELEAEIEHRTKEHDRALAEVDAAKGELLRAEREAEEYRGKVGEHFTGTSHLLRELTMQYRAVYDHLASGAGDLCPEGFALLEGELDTLPLAPAATDPEVEEPAEPDDEPEEPRSS